MRKGGMNGNGMRLRNTQGYLYRSRFQGIIGSVMRFTGYSILSLAILSAAFPVAAFAAWVGPTAPPPGNNVAAPVNVGSAAQVKNASLGVNGLAVFGNTILQTNSYLNFGDGTAPSIGTTGYGIRDNAGTLEFKNTGGTWASLQAIIAGFGGGGGSQWTTGTGAIYYNSGKVGIGTSSPATVAGSMLSVAGTAYFAVNATAPYVTVQNLGGGGGTGFQMIDNFSNSSYILKSVSTGGFKIHDNTGGTDPFQIQNSTPSNTLFLANTGNVGIGTTTPSFKLDVGNSASDVVRSYGGFSGNAAANIGGTGAAAYFPNGLWANGVNEWIYGNIYTNGAISDNSSKWSINPIGNVYFNTGGNFGIGNTSPTAKLDVTGSANVSGNVTAAAFLYSSDRRLKKDISPLSGNLAKILALQPVSWLWKDQGRGTDVQIGFIAQDVQQVIPEVVHTDAATTLEAIDYAHMAPILVGSVQELNKKMSEQQQEIDTLQAQSAAQQEQIDALTAELRRLEARL